jgi:hypothetical protein
MAGPEDKGDDSAVDGAEDTEGFVVDGMRRSYEPYRLKGLLANNDTHVPRVLR